MNKITLTISLLVYLVLAVPHALYALDKELPQVEDKNAVQEEITQKSQQVESIAQKQSDEMRFRMKPSLASGEREVLRGVLIEIVDYAAKGDSENVIDYLSRHDQNRMKDQQNSSTYDLVKESETFRTKFEKRYAESFAKAIDDAPINGQFAQGDTDLQAFVQVTNGTEKIELELVNEGTLLDAWRVNAPDTLTKSALQEQLYLALNEPLSIGDKQRIIFEVLKPLGRVVNGHTETDTESTP